jgi:hypothetical protein
MSKEPTKLDHWNYRVFKKPVVYPKSMGDAHDDQPKWSYFIGEAYYDAKMKLDGGYSDSYDGMLSGDDISELKHVYDMISEAFKAPVIVLDSKGNIIQEVWEKLTNE